VARQAENNETDDTHENTTDINPVPNVAVTGVETALTCSENEPTTSLVGYGNKFVVSWIFTGVILKGNTERTVSTILRRRIT
jgi:hypothetical protein